MRLLYVSRSSSGHDDRFIAAWRSVGVEVDSLVLELDDSDAGARLAERLASSTPDLVQVGPLTHPGWQVIHQWEGALIGTSWGFDLMDETRSSEQAAQHAAAVLQRCDLVFVDNDAPQREAIRLGADPERIRQFPWGLDEPWFVAPAREPLTGTSVTILSTRRHEPIYRVGDIVDAFVQIAPNHPTARLEIAGSGSLTTLFRRTVERSGLQGRVEFIGELGPSELRERYRAADLYVSASSVDGTSVSLLEAMASGAGVITSRIEGNAQWVDDTTGFDFPCGDVAELARILSGILAQPDQALRARERATAARARVIERADWQDTVARFPAFARDAVSHHKERA